MNGYFLFHGMLVQLTCSILELSLCPHCWRGKVFKVQRKLRMMSFQILWIREFLWFHPVKKTLKYHLLRLFFLMGLFHVFSLYSVYFSSRLCNGIIIMW